MEVLNDARFNLIETDSLIVKKMNSYIINQDTILSELASGTLYLLNSENNSLTITLPPIKTGINFEFIFNSTTNNSVTFRTSLNPLDTSKFIGTEWLYLKRSDININYSLLSGSELIFNKSEKGEYIKFYCDGLNYYIIEKNDTNNNINNIIVEYPTLVNNNYIVNINTNENGYYYSIISETTTEPIDTLMMNTTYNFKFDTTTQEYNNLINTNNILVYNLYTYIEYYNIISYNFDNNTDKKYNYKYPVFNYELYDINNNKINKLDLFNTTYIINLDNNSIKYPGYLYTTDINLDKDQNSNILANTSILNIDYNTIDDNLIIYNEFNSIIYDHINDRRFLLANRDIDYRIKYINTIFTNDISNNDIINYNNKLSFKFTSNSQEQTGFIIKLVDTIDSLDISNKLYFLYLKTTINSIDKTYKIPLLFIDQLLLQPINADSNIIINNKLLNKLPQVNDLVNYNYEFNIISNENITNNDNLELLFLNTHQSSNLIINENIFLLMKEKLIINVNKLDINNYLLNFMSTGSEINYYTTTIKDELNFKSISFNTGYNNENNINITYFSQFSNILSGNFKLNKFIIDDNYSGKIIYVNLLNDININLENNRNNNFYEIVVNEDNVLDSDQYTLIKKNNENLVEEYYFIKNNDTSVFYKNIDLYTNNKYIINLDSTINILDINRDTNNINDLIKFSDTKDGVINFKKTENYNFITKEINGDTRTLIIDLINTHTPSKIYYYNKNVRNVGGVINILSVENKLNNLLLNSSNPFTSDYKIFINNISYEKNVINGVDNYTLILKKLKKGDSIKLYYNNNTNIIRDFKFSDNDDSIIKYPENIISNTNFNLKFKKNNLDNNYDITLIDNNNNLISANNNTLQFIKNQIYSIEQSDPTNYNLDNNTINTYYLKLLYNNNNLYYTYFTDSKFTNQINNISLFRGTKYTFKQYHRSNYNPDIDIDLNRVFKVTVRKNSSNNNVFYLNNMEQYIPNLLVNTIYYFDISDVINYSFRFSLFSDGLENNILTRYDSSEIIYKTNSDNNIYLIKLELLTTNTNLQLYYYSEIFRNMGSYGNIIKSSINYLLSIDEKKYNITDSSIEYYFNKNKPVYEVLFKNNDTQEVKNNVLFYKSSQIQYLKFKLNFDNVINNKLYTTGILNIVSNPTVTIYVQEIYNSTYPELSYFQFYSDQSINSSSQIKLPLTILKNKKYTFKQVNYKTSKFKFFIFINEYPQDYVEDVNATNKYDNNILSYTLNEGFTLDTTNFMCSNIYYSGIHYNSQEYYTDNIILPVNTKLLLNYKILLIIEKDIFISDNYNNTQQRINLTENLSNNYYELTQNNLQQKNIFMTDKSHIYLKNKNFLTSKNIVLNILTNASNESNDYLNYINDNEIFISNISYSNNNNYNSKYNRHINILKNINYNFTLNSNVHNIKYFNNTLLLLDSNIINISNNKIYDYIIYKTGNNISQNNSNHDLKLPNTSSVDETIFSLISPLPSPGDDNYFTIHNDTQTFNSSIFNYFISINSNINSFILDFNTSNTIYTLISLDFINSNSNSNNSSLTITPENDKILYVNLVLRTKNNYSLLSNSTDYSFTNKNNNDIIIYNFKIVKEITSSDQNAINKIVNYGQIIPNNYDDIINKNKNIYLSKPIKYNLNSVDNTLPNTNLLNTYLLELVDTEFDSGESIKTLTNKKFVFNHDSYLNTRNVDTILEKNIVTSNLYTSDFRTITIDISNTSLIDENIIFYTNEEATNKLENNIIYKGTPGTNNSKIILNINPHIYSILYYYSDCLYESKFKYNIEIKNLVNKSFRKDSVTNSAFKNIYGLFDINIIPFLENQYDIYYNNSSTINNINLDGSYFILYNSDNLYKGNIICDKTHIETTTSGEVIHYSYSIRLLFNNDFKLYNSLHITTDYTLKLFKYTGGVIYTPNYLHLDRINSRVNSIDSSNTNVPYVGDFNSNSSSNIQTKNIIFSNNGTKYLLNNRIIDESFYLKYTVNNNEKFHLSQNNYENFMYNDEKIKNQYIDLTNTVIKYNSNNIFNISDTSTNLNKEILTRHDNTKQYLSITNNIIKQDRTINEFNILLNLYRTRIIDGTQYYSIKLNINSFTDTLLILKPYYSYTFNINKEFLLKDVDNLFYELKNINLNLVNVNDSKVLSSDYISIIDTSSSIYTLTVNIPEDSDIYVYNKIYLKLTCEISELQTGHKLNQGYFARNNTGNAYLAPLNIFTEYIPIIVDKKSVIHNNIEFKHNNYYINNYINKITIYNYYTNIFNISNINNFDINIFDNAEIIQSSTYKYKNNEKIIIYSDKKLYNNYKIRTNITSHDINVKNIYTELISTNINNDSKYIIDLYEDYEGNDSSNDFNDNIQSKYRTKYVGEPGFNGELIYNLNEILDFNINVNDIYQNLLYTNNNVYFNNNIDKYNFYNNLLNTSSLILIEPIKLKLMYQIFNTNNYIDLPNYTYSPNFFPGKVNSKLTIQIPHDIDDDNIFNENIKLVGVGHYSGQIINTINTTIIPSNIYVLPQYNSTIFLNISNNTIIRLPVPNYSLEYKFIIINSLIDSNTNNSYLLTITTNNNIFGYIDESFNKNIEIQNNNKLIFKNIAKGNSFLLTSNKENYYLENISINRSSNNVSLINFNKNSIYLPNKEPHVINVNVSEEKFILETNNTNVDKLYKNKLYSFFTNNLSTNYFSFVDLDVLNLNKINISTPLFLNNYNNLYYIFETNTPLLTDNDFNTYTNNNHNFIININISNDNILFNNSTNVPIIYSNYIYKFVKPFGFYILNNYDFSNINSTPSLSITDFINISHNYYDITVRKNNIIKHSISSDTNKITLSNIFSNNKNNILNIDDNNFKNLPVNTLIYFDSDIYHSYNGGLENMVKIITANTIYKTAVEGNNSGDIILEGLIFNNNTSSVLSIDSNSIVSISNVKAYLFRNSINYNTHKLMYVYYKSVIINDINNTLKINETASNGITRTLEFIMDLTSYNTYTYTIDNNNLQTELLSILSNKLNVENYVITIEQDRYKLVKTGVEFNIIETSLSTLLGFNTDKSKNNIIYGNIPNLQNVFLTSDYYKYYGNQTIVDYNTLDTNESNSIVSIDLDEDKHINLPNVKEGLIYTFIINNSIKNKKLYIHSFNNIHNLQNNTVGNILVLKPESNLNLNVCISISSNDNKYFISDIKGYQYILNLYTTKIYNTLNNFSNLYYNEIGISNIDKYISVYNIHVVGLKNSDNTVIENNINEQKFLHVAKTLARVLDYNQNGTIYDNNIHNSILHKNSYIMLYNNTIPNNYFITNKHHDNIFISYNDINLNYNHNDFITNLNKYDITLEKIINMLINNYINVYPHIFSYSQIQGNISNLNIYKYVDNSRLTSVEFLENNILNNVYIIDNTLNINNKRYINKYYNTNKLNYCSGTDLTIRVNNLLLDYTNTLLNIKYSIDIINIGSGYKNNDKVSITIDTNIELILTLSLIDLSNSVNLYNVFNSYNQLTNSTINDNIVNELINNNIDTLYTNDTGDITIENSENYDIDIGEKLYNKNLNNNDDVVNYVTELLLSTIGYYRLRNQKNNVLSNIDFKIITPTLVKKYNNKFIGLYLSSSLHNINNLNNINNYNLELLNYIKSSEPELLNIDLQVSNISKINDFNNLIKTYNNISFDNALDFKITKNNQYSLINFVATKTQNNVVETLPIINNTTNNSVNNTIIDISSISINDYYNTDVNINITVTSENNINTSIYNFKLNRTNLITDNTFIKNIQINSNNELINNVNNINDNSSILYFKENTNNTISIILDNIYSNITNISINNLNLINNNLNLSVNKYSYSYIFTPDYYKSTLNLTVTSENSSIQNYTLNLLKFPNNIALLDDIIITNVSNINTFNKYNFNYNGTLNKNIQENFNKNIINLTDTVSNISLHIKKTDVFSSVNTTIEYYDGNNQYVVYKSTNELFIHDILTFVKTYDTSNNKVFKTHLLNNTHTFFNIIPISNFDTNFDAFEMDVGILNNFNNNKNIFDFIPDNATVRFKKYDANNKLQDTDVNNMFPISEQNSNQYKVINNNKNEETNSSTTKMLKISNLTNSHITASGNTIDVTDTVMLINSYPFKKIQDDTTKEILNISNISNIRISVKVTSEDKLVNNNYIYIINTK